jgi:TonB family protein
MLTDSSWTRHDPFGFGSYVRSRLDDEDPMFSQLPESQPARHRRQLAIAASSLVHAALLWQAARLTATAHTAPVPSPEEIRIYVPAPNPERILHAVTQTRSGPSSPKFSLPVIDPIHVPTPVPLPIPGAPDHWPDRHSGFEPAGPPGSSIAGDGSPGTTSQPFMAGEVDRAAAPKPGAPTPVYPPDLQAAGIEGIVSVEFVVDSAGFADDRHIQIVSSDYPAFSVAARAVIARTRYFPAEAHGRRVAQLVEQSFVFRITR